MTLTILSKWYEIKVKPNTKNDNDARNKDDKKDEDDDYNDDDNDDDDDDDDDDDVSARA